MGFAPTPFLKGFPLPHFDFEIEVFPWVYRCFSKFLHGIEKYF